MNDDNNSKWQFDFDENGELDIDTDGSKFGFLTVILVGVVALAVAVIKLITASFVVFTVLWLVIWFMNYFGVAFPVA